LAVYLFITLISLLLLSKLIPPLAGNNSMSFKQQFSIIKDTKVFTGLLKTVFWILGKTMVIAYIAPLLNNLLNIPSARISFYLF